MSESFEQFGRAIISGERRGLLASTMRGVLRSAEPFYAATMTLRNYSYDRGMRVQRLARPVISVGNITTGGTGKTPAVQWLAEQLLARGQKSAVLMRGYRASESVGSDERKMLEDALKIPVRAGADRAASAGEVLREHPEVDLFILDDGFQHRKVARDFDLVLINAADPFGYGHVLPRGLLREPLRGLLRADAILLTHCDEGSTDEVTRQVRKHTQAPIFTSQHNHVGLQIGDESLPLEELTRKKFFIFAGVGSPRSLDRAMSAYEANYLGHKWFPDHHDYMQADLDELNRIAGAEMLVTTEKDWVKIRRLQPGRLPIARLILKLAVENSAAEALMAAVERAPAPGISTR